LSEKPNVLAYIDGFWFAIAAPIVVAFITRAPAGPFTPEPFKFAKMVMRRCGLSAST